MLRGVSSSCAPQSVAAVSLDRLQVDGRLFARGNQRVWLRGVTYGPFAPNSQGDPFPPRHVVRADLVRMREVGFNTLRAYHVPPQWLLEEITATGQMGVLIDIPWSKHLCFLDSASARKSARSAVRKAALLGGEHPCVWAYSIGNEITPEVIRWHGARRVQRFLTELVDVVKQADPRGLVTYANYPPAEYLDLSFLDFVTFNVYLHDRETFRRYLCRLQNLVGDKPLVLGEIGMDTLRHGEIEQAEFLSGHTRDALLRGLAGMFVFSWTDEWHTGDHSITDWAFGITNHDRAPKASYHAMRELFEQDASELLPARPMVSVVVCSYNGGSTLKRCLESLAALNYPDFEVIVVDDGSTDNTRELLAEFPWVVAIHQPNRGLSAARNAGLEAARGSVIAYTDSDCFVDSDWLTLLVAQLEASGASAVGGPNLPPEDGWLPACVAAAPGQPTHVLESDQVAEHIPGCNMAIRRDALAAINGFDAEFRKAGDDVDVCWRLQQAGKWITFAPGAFVWHHRRQGPRAYLRQQSGYGEAEALLRFKHPDKYNNRGHGIWRGVLYGSSLQGPVLDRAIIYRGTFATGYFQCIYQPAPAHWAMLPSTLEWHIVAALATVGGLVWWPALMVGLVMVLLSLAVAGLQAAQARLAPQHDGLRSRLLVAALCYAQPLVRSWARWQTRYRGQRAVMPSLPAPRKEFRRWAIVREVAYWGDQLPDRTRLLQQAATFLCERRCGRRIDTGWLDCDLEVSVSRWSLVRVCTAHEEHGSGRRLIRIRYSLHPSTLTKVLTGTGLLAAGAVIGVYPSAAGVTVGAVALCWLVGVWRALRLGSQVAGVFDSLAVESGLTRLQTAAPSTAGSTDPE